MRPTEDAFSYCANMMNRACQQYKSSFYRERNGRSQTFSRVLAELIENPTQTVNSALLLVNTSRYS